MEKTVIKKETIITGLIVAFWLCVTLIVLGLFDVHDGWPAFLVLTLFTLEGSGKLETLKPIFIGAAVGIIIAAGFMAGVAFLSSNLGLDASTSGLVTVFIAVFLIIVLEDLSLTVFNGYSFIYFTVALIPTEQTTLVWLAVLFFGGAFFVAGVIMLLKLVEKLSTNKAKQTDNA